MSAQTVRIASMALRVLFLLQLILGLLFWFNVLTSLVLLHMLIGLLFVIDVWYLGVVQGLQRNGSLGLTVGTFLLGLLIAIFGMAQETILQGNAHWIIQVIHLLLGMSGIALGEICVARYNRGASATEPAVR